MKSSCIKNEKVDGACPVAEFFESLEPKMWAKVARNIDFC